GLLLGSLSGAAVLPAAATAPASVAGRGVTRFGVRPGPPEDRSKALQRAIDKTASSRTPPWLQPGGYSDRGLQLLAGAQLAGVREQTRFVLAHGSALFSAEHAEAITLSGLVLDGDGKPLPPRHGLVQLEDVRALRITDCSILRAGGDGIALMQCDGT